MVRGLRRIAARTPTPSAPRKRESPGYRRGGVAAARSAQGTRSPASSPIRDIRLATTRAARQTSAASIPAQAVRRTTAARPMAMESTRTGSSDDVLPGSVFLRRGECLVQIPQDIVERLEPDGEPDHFGRNAG